MEENKIIIYNSPDGKTVVSLFAKDGTVWLNQNQIGELFGTSKQNIGQHIGKILKERELDANSVVKNYFTTASDGKNYEVSYYNLEMILAIGFRVRGFRGIQFRKWANQNLQEFLTKGFILDDERMKNPKDYPDYFDELLSRIRDIRASEKRFYQKVRDLFALSSDYDASDETIQSFFAETQNKLLFAITGLTAAEIIVSRADASQPNMGLTSWKGSTVRRQDIFIAKNYLSSDEIDRLNRLVVIFLETAELRARNRNDLTIAFWRNNADRIIEMNEMQVLDNQRRIRSSEMERIVGLEYESSQERRNLEDAQYADFLDMEELKKLQKPSEKNKDNM